MLAGWALVLLRVWGSEPRQSVPMPVPGATWEAAQGRPSVGARDQRKAGMGGASRVLHKNNCTEMQAGGPGGLPVGRGGSRVFGRTPGTSRLYYARGSFGDEQ